MEINRVVPAIIKIFFKVILGILIFFVVLNAALFGITMYQMSSLAKNVQSIVELNNFIPAADFKGLQQYINDYCSSTLTSLPDYSDDTEDEDDSLNHSGFLGFAMTNVVRDLRIVVYDAVPSATTTTGTGSIEYHGVSNPINLADFVNLPFKNVTDDSPQHVVVKNGSKDVLVDTCYRYNSSGVDNDPTDPLYFIGNYKHRKQQSQILYAGISFTYRFIIPFRPFELIVDKREPLPELNSYGDWRLGDKLDLGNGVAFELNSGNEDVEKEVSGGLGYSSGVEDNKIGFFAFNTFTLLNSDTTGIPGANIRTSLFIKPIVCTHLYTDMTTVN